VGRDRRVVLVSAKHERIDECNDSITRRLTSTFMTSVSPIRAGACQSLLRLRTAISETCSSPGK